SGRPGCCWLSYTHCAMTRQLDALSLHVALPIHQPRGPPRAVQAHQRIHLALINQLAGRLNGHIRLTLAVFHRERQLPPEDSALRSEEHTSELQSRENLVCRLLLEPKNGS